MDTSTIEQRVFAIERPHRNLLGYYVLSSFVLGPLFLIPLIPRFFRYETLRIRFDEEGISMRWGLLFRKEIHLTYSRIQDIHLRSNFVERWLGLARVEIQTASGSARAEMTIEGLLEFEEVRDFVYSRMRGFRQGHESALAPAPVRSAAIESSDSADELATVLRQVADELRAIRQGIESRQGPVPPDA
jgi:putative membrane protein